MELYASINAQNESASGSINGEKNLTGEANNNIYDKNFIHNQKTASSVWAINHLLSKLPSVTVIDSANNVVIGDVVYIDNDNISIVFSSEFSGKAILN